MDKLSTQVALNQQCLIDHFDNINTALRNQCLSAPGLAIGSPATGVTIANTVTYTNNGIFKSKTTAEVAFTATDHDIAANADSVQEAMYLVCLDKDGNATLHMGTIATGSGKALLPDVPDGKTPIGAVRIAVAAGSTPFNATTDALSAAHITDTYYDYGYLAPRFDAAL